MEKHRNNNYIFLLIIFLGILGFSFFNILVTFKQKQAQDLKTSQPSNYQPKQANAKTPLEISVGSPDGKWKLTMKEEKGKDSINYTFTAGNTLDGIQNVIFTKNLPLGESMSIPANTFSPDDKYVFLKHTSAVGDNYTALSVTGGPIKDVQTLDFSSIFASKYEDYKITEATGWGGVNLIVFNTDKTSGGIGPSFWFEVPSGAFTKLSNRFN